TPPTPVDAAAPAPAVAPHLDSPDLVPVEFASAKVLPPGSIPPYSGTEYKLGPLLIRPAELHMEAVMLVLIASYLVGTVLVRNRNKAKATAWFKANEQVMREEFAGVGFGGKDLFKVDGGDEFVGYVSGRRAVEHAWTKITLGGFDVLSTLYVVARSAFDPAFDPGHNRIVIDFKLPAPAGTPGSKFCFAVLRRDVLKKVRDGRWDLRTFTTLSENPAVSPEMIVMTESGDITNAVLKDQATGLQDAMQAGAPGLEYFESLVISDMPAEEPDSAKPSLPNDEFHIVLTLRLPPRSDPAATAPFIRLACNIADVLHKKEKILPDNALSKLKKRRAEVLDSLMKPLRDEQLELEAEKKADALALKRKMEKDKLDAKLANMSAADRIKYKQKEEEKERKKRVMKLNKKKMK
ncbi:hypothetical protein JCM10212_001303, partial [Sporobolomyces blumeae]